MSKVDVLLTALLGVAFAGDAVLAAATVVIYANLFSLMGHIFG